MAAATRDADFARDRLFLSRTIVSSFESTPFTAANAKRCRLANDSNFNQLENSLLQASVTRQPSRPCHAFAPNCCLKGLIANEFFQFFTRPCRVWVTKVLVRRERMERVVCPRICKLNRTKYKYRIERGWKMEEKQTRVASIHIYLFSK